MLIGNPQLFYVTNNLKSYSTENGFMSSSELRGIVYGLTINNQLKTISSQNLIKLRRNIRRVSMLDTGKAN